MQFEPTIMVCIPNLILFIHEVWNICVEHCHVCTHQYGVCTQQYGVCTQNNGVGTCRNVIVSKLVGCIEHSRI